MLKQIVLDTETTGISAKKGHRIIEIGCLLLVDRQKTKETFHVYLNPDRDIDEGAKAVHGIDEAFLADKPRFADIAEEFMNFVRGSELIIHNASFDIGFLDHELKRLGNTYGSMKQHCQITDSLALARKKHPGQANSLDALCRRYDVDNTSRTLHGALLDAELLADVYLRLTGGQKALFQKGNRTDKTITQSDTQTPQRVADLPVITANAAELAAHDAFLQQMQNKGECVWLEKETA